MTSPSGGGSAGNGSFEVARGYATIVVNDQTAAGLASVQGQATRTVRQIQSTSQIARNSIQGIFQGLGTQITQTALGPLLNVGEGVARLNNQFETSGSKAFQWGQNISAGLISVGATMLLVGAKEQQAQAQLAQSIDNSGQSFEDYAGQIDAVISKQADLGHTAVSVQNAMAVLDNSTHDAQATIDDFGEVSDLAAAKHENLNTAARQVAVTIGGGGRLFRQYNIEIQKNVDGTTDYVAMNKQLADVLSGQASASADNFGGHLRALSATIENTFASAAQTWGPWITGLGVVGELASTVLQVKFVKGLNAAITKQNEANDAALLGKSSVDGEAASYSAFTANLLASAEALQEVADKNVGTSATGVGASASSDTSAIGAHRAAVEADTEAEGRHAEAEGAVTVESLKARAAAEQETAAMDAKAMAASRVAEAMRQAGISEETVAVVAGKVETGSIGEAAALDATAAAAEGLGTATGTAAAGSVGLLGVLGPLGLVAGLAVGALMLFGSSESDAIGPVSGLTDALVQQNGVFDANTEKLIASKVAQSGLIDIGNKLFVNTGEITQALNGNASAAADTAGKVQAIIDAYNKIPGDYQQKLSGQQGHTAQVLAGEYSTAVDFMSKYNALQKQIDLQEKEAEQTLEQEGTREANALHMTAAAYLDVKNSVDKTNASYASGKTNIQASIIGNDQLKATLNETDDAWLQLANDMMTTAGQVTNGGVTHMNQAIQNVDESLQAVTADFQPLTDAYSSWQTSVAATASAEAQGAASIEAAQESLSNARDSATDTAVSGAESIQKAEKAVADQYVSDAKTIASAEDAITSSQEKALTAQKALDDARSTAADNLVKAERELRDVGENNDKAGIALQAAQLKASQDQVAAAQEALNNSTGLTQQQLLDRQAAINVQAAANAAEASQLAQQQTKYDVTDAQNNLSDTLVDNAKASAAAAQTVKDGVDGAQNVLDAQKALADANKGVQDSVQALADAKSKAAQDEQDQLDALTKARQQAAKANSQAAKQVQDAQSNLASAQATAQANTQAATAAEEQNRVKLDELEAQTGQTDKSVLNISQDIKDADTNLDIAMSSSGQMDVENSIIGIKQNLEEALLMAGGMDAASASSKAHQDNPWSVAPDAIGYVTMPGGGRKPVATGGAISGPGTGTSDSIAAWLSNGEHVWTAAEVQAAGGHANVERMRKMVMGKYAEGGEVINLNSMHLADLMNASGRFKFGYGVVGAGATGSSRDYASLIIGEAKRLGLGQRGAEIGLITALAESGLKNYANSNIPQSLNIPHDAIGSDHYSLGLFQQQSGPFGSSWGTVQQVMNPTYATDRFFQSMVGVANWRNLDPGVVAQRVQVSAYPDAYDRQLPSADSLLASIGFDSGGVLGLGSSLVHNKTGKPEAIFTNEQAQAIADMAKSNANGIHIEKLIMQIDASSVKEFNDVVQIFEQLETKIRSASGATIGMATR